MRYFSKKRAENLRKINPRVPFPDAASTTQSFYQIEANISGLNNKTHMKIILKWMRGKKVLKLLCNHIGLNKKFLYYVLIDECQSNQRKTPSELSLQIEKPLMKEKF
ncbi:hypothetical protein K2173_002377 [Erythroxylum novogranatense]|uniref:Uncharacterized protein n=1 Tax=Erythroxylum novogranatense TaxID=1862640 RepID=A0AAV8TB16_9ROSI|nr:hypothetical protein K2173_002377 [Erythroxylum novogranatense]